MDSRGRACLGAARVKGSLELPPRGLQRAPAGVSVGMLGRG